MCAKYNDCELVIRRANKEDMVAVADMIQELADYEKMSDGPQITVKGWYVFKHNYKSKRADTVKIEASKRREVWPMYGAYMYIAAHKRPGGRNSVLTVNHYRKLSPINNQMRDGFETNPPAFQCLVGELTKDTSIVGYALYFPIYSTWQGRSMMLEDLYVHPSERGRGVGKKLFNAVAKEAKVFGSSRLDFHVLEWNEARSFYEGAGAVNLTNTEQWCCYRLTGDALEVAASKAVLLK